MRQVFLQIGLLSKGNRYLVGYCTDLREFFDKHYKCHESRPDETNWSYLGNFVEFWHEGQHQTCSLAGILIDNNMTCFYKSI